MQLWNDVTKLKILGQWIMIITCCKLDECSMLENSPRSDLISEFGLNAWFQLGMVLCTWAFSCEIAATKDHPAHQWYHCHLMMKNNQLPTLFEHTFSCRAHSCTCTLLEHVCRKLMLLPVITTSLRLFPNTKLMYLPPAASLPWPYDGKGSTKGQVFISWNKMILSGLNDWKC